AIRARDKLAVIRLVRCERGAVSELCITLADALPRRTIVRVSRVPSKSSFGTRVRWLLEASSIQLAQVSGGIARSRRGALGIPAAPLHGGVTVTRRRRGFVTDAATSLRMAGVRREGTRPELAVAHAL